MVARDNVGSTHEAHDDSCRQIVGGKREPSEDQVGRVVEQLHVQPEHSNNTVA